MKANGVQKYLEFHCIDKSVFFDSHTDLEPHEYISDDCLNFSYFLFIFDFQLYCKGKKKGFIASKRVVEKKNEFKEYCVGWCYINK